MVESDSETDLYTEEQILGDGLEVLSQCDESVDDPEEYDLKFHFDSVYSAYTEEEEEQEELWDGNQEINDLLAPFIGENYTPKRSLLFGANERKMDIQIKSQLFSYYPIPLLHCSQVGIRPKKSETDSTHREFAP